MKQLIDFLNEGFASKRKQKYESSNFEKFKEFFNKLREMTGCRVDVYYSDYNTSHKFGYKIIKSDAKKQQPEYSYFNSLNVKNYDGFLFGMFGNNKYGLNLHDENDILNGNAHITFDLDKDEEDELISLNVGFKRKPGELTHGFGISLLLLYKNLDKIYSTFFDD